MSAWGREDESSSSISTTSSSNSRRREPEMDIFAVRKRIVDKIMAKKQREEAEKSKDTGAPEGASRKSRAPLADLQESNNDMELTQRASTSSDAGNFNWSLDTSKRKVNIYSSTPLPGRTTGTQKTTPASPSRSKPKTPTKSKPPKTSVIPEAESEEESPPSRPVPTPKATTPQVPSEKKKRGRPKKSDGGSRTKPPPKPKLPQRPPPLEEEEHREAFQSSDDEDVPVAPQDDSEDEQASGPSTRRTSRVQPTKSPAKPAKKTPAKPAKSSSSQPTEEESQPGPSTSRAQSSSASRTSRSTSRRKATPRKASPSTRRAKLFKELRKLQNEPGFLIPRLPFMRVVREIAENVAIQGSHFKFTVDAMEALQTATEYYLTQVFTDASALANHARRVTVMPRDLDLLRKLRIVDA